MTSVYSLGQYIENNGKKSVMSNDLPEMLVEMDGRKHLTTAREKWMLMSYKEGSRLHIQGRSTIDIR